MTRVIEIPMYRFIKTQVIDDKEVDLEEPDTIPDGEEYVTVGLPKESFPRTLRTMTATEAGEWAVRRCVANKWEPTPDNIWSALANLEIDMD